LAARYTSRRTFLPVSQSSPECLAMTMTTFSDANYRLMLDSVVDTEIIMLDAQGIIRTWNQGAQNLKGYSAAEAIGQPVTIFYTPEDVKAGLAQREMETAERTGRFEYEGWRVKKGGAKFWAGVVLQPMRDESGKLLGYVKTARDLTGKRKREEDARTAALILKSIDDTEIILLDKDGLIRTWNVGAKNLKGYEASEVLGKPVTIFYPPEDVQSNLWQRELATARQTGRFEFEGWRLKKGGAKFWANVVLTPVTDERGEHIGYLKIVRDLSERLEREHLLQRQRDEILELSTPVMQVWDKVLALPIIGTLDSVRASRLTEGLLQKIAGDGAEIVIIDISGVPTIDTQVAHHLLKTVQGARLMGAECILSGVRPEIAQAMVRLGIELGTLRSRATLSDALQLALHLREQGAREAAVVE
jgi:PAS domain S-box-containing protein